MLGVLIGSFCSFLYRGIDIVYYNTTRIMLGSWKRTLRRIVRNLIILVLLMLVGLPVMRMTVSGYGQWFLGALAVAVISALAFAAVNAFSEPREFRLLMDRLRKVIGFKRGKRKERKHG